MNAAELMLFHEQRICLCVYCNLMAKILRVWQEVTKGNQEVNDSPSARAYS